MFRGHLQLDPAVGKFKLGLHKNLVSNLFAFFETEASLVYSFSWLKLTSFLLAVEHTSILK
jgi:hypothetical protein